MTHVRATATVHMLTDVLADEDFGCIQQLNCTRVHHSCPTHPPTVYWDGCVDAIALLLVRCKRSSLMLLRRLPPLLTLRERSRPPLLCRRPLL